LALGATPVATLELELELLLELEEEPESPFDALLLDFPPALELETAAACSPSLRLPAGRPMAMLASMGAMPRAIAISHRVRFIVLSVLSVCAKTPPARRAIPTERNTHDYPRSHTSSRDRILPFSMHGRKCARQLRGADKPPFADRSERTYCPRE